MNYRHAYHAGNIGDVLKHAVLTRLILYFQRKDKGFRILDTHAGIGLYDLTSEETGKTGEWLAGIGKVLSEDMPPHVLDLLKPWLEAVRQLNPGSDLTFYPGSPCLARALMRPNDRLTLTELHPDDFKILARRFGGDHQVKTIHLDGWMGLGGFVPPKEKRGLVLIDPAYEVSDEFDRMTNALVKAHKKWAKGTYALWYPLKNRKAVDRMHASFSEAGLRDVLGLELKVGQSGPDTVMLGSGMTVINPPFLLAEEMRTILPWFAKVLRQGPGAGWAVETVIGE
ncbi:ribosomal RNA large subunit methyltransferase J [Roseibium aquae]|uniref:Ribosomal RNA large subunit methyltransferase J n=1 Tax=Roseibium aquae TaxID=1323746 RepID=A0A916T842_9HYPH|nr:23S rRNA (adenine(2030)-N(6))-methyltransferase RlmJ [Roseibium aquae]GGB35227.1 ribosomal RNA large subunit methyltransferase J [Roseibium aquae]